MDLQRLLRVWGRIGRKVPALHDCDVRRGAFDDLYRQLQARGNGYLALVWPSAAVLPVAASSAPPDAEEAHHLPLPCAAFHSLPTHSACSARAFLIEHEAGFLLVLAGFGEVVAKLPAPPDWLRPMAAGGREDLLTDLRASFDSLICFGIETDPDRACVANFDWPGVLTLQLEQGTAEGLSAGVLGDIERNKPLAFLRALPEVVDDLDEALTYNYYIRLLLGRGRILREDLAELRGAEWLADDLRRQTD